MDPELESAVDEKVKSALSVYQGQHGIRPSIIQQTIVNAWVGTFIYQLFVGETPLGQTILDFVRQYRPGANPKLGDPWKFGSYNYNVEIIFDDGIALFRFPIPGVVAFPDDKIRAEVATIRFIDEHTSIPVPHIHHWGTAADNPTGLNVPFIIMEHIPHATTVGQALEDPDFQIPSVPEDEKREYLYQQMADICLQLYNLTSDRIGSLGILDSGAYTIDSMPFTHVIANQVINCRVPVSVLPPRRKTYSSSQDYFTDVSNMQLAELLFIPDEFLESSEDYEDQFAARYLLRETVKRRQSDSERPTETGHTDREVFRLWGDDFRPENVLLDQNGKVVGVVDWEYTYFAPESYTINPPWWLYNEFLEEDDDSVADFSEAIHETGGLDIQDNEPAKVSIHEQWNQAVSVFLGVMEKREQVLRDNREVPEVQRQGHFLASVPGHKQPGYVPTAPKILLSQRMRWRWTLEKSEYAFTTAVYSEVLFEKYFWDYIDQSRLERGETVIEGHEARLQLLNTPAKTLMDWFLHIRANERQEWNGKLLLDHVLSQMDSVILGKVPGACQ